MNRKRWLLLLAGFLALLCLSAGGLLLMLRSDWLEEQVRQRIVSEIRRASGGATSLERFDFDWKTMTANAAGFTLRGKEPANDEPLFRASRIELRLSVLSWLGRDIRLRELTVFKPRLRVLVFPDGTTNLPQPPAQAGDVNALESLMRLKIERIDLREGWLSFDGRERQFDLLAEGLDLKLAFDSARKRYRVDGSLQALGLPGGYRPSLTLAGWLETNRFQAEMIEARLGASRIRSAGLIDFSPLLVEATYESKLSSRDFPQLKSIRGTAVVNGQLRWAGGELAASGSIDADGIGFEAGSITVEQVKAAGLFDLNSGNLTLNELAFTTPFGAGTVDARLRQGKEIEIAADVDWLSLGRLQQLLLERPYEWSGTGSGHVAMTGSLSPAGLAVERAGAVVEIEPDEGQTPLSGSVTLAWDRNEDQLKLDGTSLATPQSRLNVTGSLGRQLAVNLNTRSIREVEAVARIAARDSSFTLPVRLENGEAALTAKVSGPIERPAISGRLQLTNARVDEVPFDSLDAHFDLTQSHLEVSRLSLRQSEAILNGKLSAQLSDWRADWSTPIDVQIRIEHASIEPTLGLFRVRSPLKGFLDGSIEAKGPAGAPALKVRANGSSLQLGQEKVRKASFDLDTEAGGEFQGRLTLDSTTHRISGRLQHAEGDFSKGSVRLTVSTPSLRLGEIETLQSQGPKLEGVLSAELTAEASFNPGGLRLNAVNGAVASPELSINDRKLQRVELRSETLQGIANLTLRCSVRGESEQNLDARATLKLDGEPLLAGSVKFPRVSFAFLRAVARTAAESSSPMEPLPVRGFLEGDAVYSLNLNKPETLKASLAIRRLQLRPRENQLLETQVESSELTLANNSPVLIDIENDRAVVKSSSFIAKETQLALSGSVGLSRTAPLNLRVTGGVNLAVLSTFRPEVDARGRAELDATVRGTAADPSLSGKMSIAGASFYLKDITNGIENANGTIFFERNRANIERLTGQTGGGEFQISGFVGMNGGDLNYRLTARGKAIRIRYPEGVSTTADATLDLVGSPTRSLLTGTVTILRSGFVAGDDFGEMMGSAASPVSQPAARNEFLRNLQFDVKVRTAPDATLVSSYTEGLETEANLQIRGSPSKPIVLGNIEVNQGAIRFFGNRYTISRGEMLFYNTAVVQPEIDLDLETRIRGVTVYIKVSGPLTRLNVNYRSEPPLQSNEILALLTVGRSPSAAEGNLQASSSIRTSNVLENTSSNSLLGGALSAGISSRVERFFGASRIKIDPQATGVDNVAQARLSIEQSLSRDVTVTFITNLSRTQEQIVRVEWDVSRQWQVIAVRDERGVFAVDFIFRKRFR